MRVNLFYLSPNLYGGWITFTAHLKLALESVGIEARVFKILESLDDRFRNFGYGVEYQNVPIWDIDSLEGINVLAVVGKQYATEACELVEEHGAHLVIHDPTELQGEAISELKDMMEDRKPPVYVIRKANLQRLPGSQLLLHPYEALDDTKMRWKAKRPWKAVAVSRIDFDKNTHLILDANRLLSEKDKVRIYGYENRVYTKADILPGVCFLTHYPEWEQSKVRYERERRTALELCAQAEYMVDMSAIKGDGGGTQYTFLEAMDAGAICILNKEWIIEDDEMVPGLNCLVAEDGQEIADVLHGTYDRMYLHQGAQEVLERHSLENVGQQFKEMLDVKV